MRRTLNKHKYIYQAVCKNSPGYLVKIPFKAKTIQKWFLTKTYKSEASALSAAIKWRDETCEKSGRNEYGKAWTIGSGLHGYAGIHKYKIYRNSKLSSGKIKRYSSNIIQVTGTRINGRLQIKRLYLSCYNNLKDAFEEALIIRKQFIKEMNQKTE